MEELVERENDICSPTVLEENIQKIITGITTKVKSAGLEYLIGNPILCRFTYQQFPYTMHHSPLHFWVSYGAVNGLVINNKPYDEASPEILLVFIAEIDKYLLYVKQSTLALAEQLSESARNFAFTDIL